MKNGIILALVTVCCILGIVCCVQFFYIRWLKRNIKNESEIKEKIDFFRGFWGNFVFYVIATSVIGLFLGSVFFENVIGLNEINSWVSIVLGLVALIIGIISLYLSFFNVDQANNTQKETVQIIQTFKTDTVDRLNLLQKAIELKIEDSQQKTDSKIDRMFDYKATGKTSINTETSQKSWEE